MVNNNYQKHKEKLQKEAFVRYQKKNTKGKKGSRQISRTF